MIGTTDLAGKNILEPSAGKGDIVDFCIERGAHVTACEKNEQLATIVASKARFLKHDFFKVSADEVSHVDYIIMNPPFSNADKHILHAWEVAPDGCEIIALCNYATLSNAHSMYRSQLRTLIHNYGHSTNLGEVFRTAERTTDVEIGLVHLFKPVSTDSFDGYFDQEADEDEEQFNGLIKHNSIREAVQRYVGACKLFDQVADNAVLMNSLVGEFGVINIAFSLKQDEKEASVASFKKELQKKAWLWVFNKMNMQKYLTESLKKEINVFVEKQQNVPFTMRNVYKMLHLIAGTHSSRMEKAMVEIFDKLTMHYHENRYSVEGWKTNSHYLVNQKFILEYVAEHSITNGAPSIRYNGNALKMDDLCKALCYITGQFYNDRDTLYGFFQGRSRRENDKTVYEYKQWGTWYEWQFFDVKLYKKGTLHAKFKDKKVWEMFNRAVAQAKDIPCRRR